MTRQSPSTEDPAAAVTRRSEALLKDLLLMRKDAGFKPRRIAKAPRLRHLLGGEAEPFENLKARMVSAIHSLHEGDSELLLDVFGLSPEAEPLPLLKDRRAYCAKKTGVSVDTVANREAPALEHLRTQLTTGWYPKSPLALRVPMTHNGAIQEFVEVVTVIGDRKWQETREHYRFVAAFDEMDFIAISRSVPGIPVSVGDFTVQTHQIGQSLTHRFYSPEPMRRGQAYDLKFRMLPDPEIDDSEILIEESRAFHEPTRSATFEAVFLGEKPRRIWSYTGLTFFERPGDPSETDILHLGSGTSARAGFSDLYGGLHSGIAWEW